MYHCVINNGTFLVAFIGNVSFMENLALSNYLGKPGQFKLKSGKVIFGVIWKAIANSDTLYFASSSDYDKIVKAHSLLKHKLLSKYAYSIAADEIVLAQSQLKEVG